MIAPHGAIFHYQWMLQNIAGQDSEWDTELFGEPLCVLKFKFRLELGLNKVCAKIAVHLLRRIEQIGRVNATRKGEGSFGMEQKKGLQIQRKSSFTIKRPTKGEPSGCLSRRLLPHPYASAFFL